MTPSTTASTVVLNPTTATIGQLVRLRGTFMASIDLDQAGDPDYRARCRDAYIYVPEDGELFKNVVLALTNQLPNGRRVLLEQGPFGVGKSLLDIVRGDLFSAPATGDNPLFEKLPRTWWRDQVEELTHDAGFLVVYLAGAHPQVRERLDRALLEALECALPSDVRLESEFERAVAWVQTTDLKDKFRRHLVEVALGGEPWTLEQLLEGLRRHEPRALDVFHQALDATADWPTAAFGGASAAQVYEEVRAAHVGDGKRFGGMLIFFDEFSQWAASASPADLAALQALVEWVNRSRRVAMVISSQERPQRDGEGHNALETLISRAQPISFQRLSYANLLGDALERTVGPYAPVDKRPEWTELTDLHRELFPSDERPEARVRRYYPFHPATVRALPELADKLGHHERSITQYLDSGEDPRGFGRFLEGPLFEHEGARLRLITIDRLFVYFEPRLSEDHQPIHALYRQAAAAARDDLGRRLAQALALCDVLGVAAPVAPTRDGLIRLLHLPPGQETAADLERRLQELEDAGLAFADGEGRYRLTGGGGLSQAGVERAIGRIKQGMLSGNTPVGADIAIPMVHGYEKLRRKLAPHGFAQHRPNLALSRDLYEAGPSVESEAYRQTFKVRRSFEVRLIGRGQLLQIHTRVAADPLEAQYETILVVVATDTEAQPSELDEVRRAAREVAQAGMAVGVPRRLLALSDAIREVQAAEQVYQHDQAYKGTPYAERALMRRQDRLLEVLAAELGIDAFEWYTPDLGSGDTAASASSLSEIADRVALYLGRGLPRGIAHEGLVGQLGQQVQRKGDVIERLLARDDIQLTGRANKPQWERIIRGALAPIGLVRIATSADPTIPDTARVVEPDATSHPDTRAVWDVLEAALMRGGGAEAIRAAAQILARAPFWLPLDLSTYIFAGFIGRRDLRLHHRGEPLGPDPDRVKRAWEDPTDYELRPVPRTSFTADVRHLLREIWDAMKEAPPLAGRNWAQVGRAASLTDEQVVALAADIRAWDTAIGRLSRALAVTLGLTWPAPVAAWLDFVAALEDGTLAREEGATYARILPERLADPTMTVRQVAARLEGQVRELAALVAEAKVLRHAADTQAALPPEAPLVAAWEAFRAAPLDPAVRRTVREALTAQRVAEQTADQPTGEQDEPGGVGDESATATLPDATTTGNAGATERSPSEERWLDAAAALAARDVDAGGIERCLEVLAELEGALGAHGGAISGKVLLVRLAEALESTVSGSTP